MTYSSWPFENQDTTETQYSKLFRELKSTGVIGSPGGTALAAVASSGMQVSLSIGSAIVRGHFFECSVAEDVAVEASDTSLRVDILVLELDPASNSISPKVIKGTPGSSTPPTPTQTDAGIYQLKIADISVDANVSSINSGDITDRRVYSGSEIYLISNSYKPALPAGSLGVNISTSNTEIYNGASWVKTSVAVDDIVGAGAMGKTLMKSSSKNNAKNSLGISWGTGDAPSGGALGDIYIKIL